MSSDQYMDFVNEVVQCVDLVGLVMVALFILLIVSTPALFVFAFAFFGDKGCFILVSVYLGFFQLYTMYFSNACTFHWGFISIISIMMAFIVGCLRY